LSTVSDGFRRPRLEATVRQNLSAALFWSNYRWKIYNRLARRQARTEMAYERKQRFSPESLPEAQEDISSFQPAKIVVDVFTGEMPGKVSACAWFRKKSRDCSNEVNAR
jgi:hypothetical protein